MADARSDVLDALLNAEGYEREALANAKAYGGGAGVTAAVLSVSQALRALVVQGEADLAPEPPESWASPWTPVGSPNSVPRCVPLWAWAADYNGGQPFVASFSQDPETLAWHWFVPAFQPRLASTPDPAVSHWALLAAPEPPEVTT